METLKQDVENANIICAAVRNIPNPVLISDVAVDDSDKILTVPANKIWEILWVWINFTTTADAGNRQLRIDIRDDSDNVLILIQALNVQVASTTERYLISPNGQEPKETVAGKHYLPIPPKLFLPASYDIRIFDVAVIQVAADDMIIRMMVNQYDTQDT